MLKKIKFKIFLTGLVNLYNNKKLLKMSKRSGEYTTIRDLLAEVNKDVVRFIMVMRSSDSHFDFDLGKCLEDSDDNPVIYIQYANARISSIIQKTNISDYDLSKTKYLINENKKYNLTTIVDPRDVIKKHFLDSVLPLVEIQKKIKNFNYDNYENIIDFILSFE